MSLPARKELLFKVPGPLIFFFLILSEGTVYSCFVCNLQLLAPVPPTAGALPSICPAALVFFQIAAYFHTVGTIVATLECLLSELD